MFKKSPKIQSNLSFCFQKCKACLRRVSTVEQDSIDRHFAPDCRTENSNYFQIQTQPTVNEHGRHRQKFSLKEKKIV